MKRLVFLPIALLLHSSLFAQLNPGDIMFVSFNADGFDGYQIVALAPIPANTTIYFTDNEWTGAGFNSGETFWIWSTASEIVTGSVLLFVDFNHDTNPLFNSQAVADMDPPEVNIGSVDWFYDSRTAPNGNGSGLAAGGESIFAYLGTGILAPTTFLTAFTTDSFAGCTLTGAASVLAIGSNVVSLSGNRDVCVFDNDGTNDTSVTLTCNGTIAQCAAMIANASNWQTDDGPSDQDADANHPNFPLNIITSGTLFPIELVSFEGRIQEDGILLEWITASESNNDYMAVERSATGRDFVELGRISGQGTSYDLQHYQFLDKNPLPSVNYYRLRQVDFDGRKEYHKVIALDYKGPFKGQIASLFPNQVAQMATLQLPSALNTDLEARVYNLMGQWVASFDIPAGTDAYEMDLAHLSTGQYAVLVTMGQQTEVLRFNKL
ncbi:MAG TPA: hypothetical protein PKA00_20180 [Saprospiraceae bacterium]|nr:hypothetical protein [Saprospiraceae bacterium]HMQ85240.1 hypothetical protein [Saprospiraceae bacterium]